MYFSLTMGSIDPTVSVQPIFETKRKVSIQTEPAESRLSYDSLGYDLHTTRRKISQVINLLKKIMC